MNLSKEKIVQILLTGNYINQKDIDDYHKSGKKSREEIIDHLKSEGLITADIIGQAIAEHFKIPYADLNTNIPNCQQVLNIPEKIAKELRIVLFSVKNKEIVISTDQPDQENLKEKLKKLFPKYKTKIAFSLTEDINSIFSCYQKNLKEKFTEISKEGNKVATKILETIFEDSINLKASDVHFEPNNDGVLLRFRIDGVLRDIINLEKSQYENILNRIKVQSGIRLDQHFTAQDGAISYEKDGKITDFRVSLVPTVWGEKVVLRILSSYVQGLILTELGLSDYQQKIIKESAKKPFGMIIVSGPTGSGKTTTLYALLKIVNQENLNITTIEDPVEYKTKGINQIQVNPETNLTFAKGLRSIVRQDPDVILVGEMRDRETTEIAVNAALTGHLLFSTFHANDAATTVPRLLAMGVEPFLLASTLELLVSQRLARKICESCKYSKTIKNQEIVKLNPKLKQYFKNKEYTIYEGKGCESCGQSGYAGRTALFEIIKVSKDMQDLILKNPSSQEIWALAKKEGAISIFEDGVEKVKNGVTSFAELFRVAEIPN